jgi:hypothetical protein
MKEYRGVDIQLMFLTLVLDGLSCPCHFSPRKESPITTSEETVGPRVDLDMVVKRKNPCLCWVHKTS